MPYPARPSIEYSYTAFEQSQGNGDFPGHELDVDLANLKHAVDDLNTFVRGVTRSDGRLANGSVSLETLSAGVRIGLEAPTEWAPATAYAVGATVFEGPRLYVTERAHTSSADFSTDEAGGLWTRLADFSPPAGALVAANNLSDLASAASARSNLGLGPLATETTVAQANGGTGTNSLAAAAFTAAGAVRARSNAERAADMRRLPDFYDDADGADWGLAFNRAIAAARDGDTIFVPGKADGYPILTPVAVNKAVFIWGGLGQGPKITLSTAITAFTLSAFGAAIEGMRIEGTRTPNQKAVLVSAPEARCRNMQIDLVDIGIHQTNGNHQSYSFLWMRNIRTTAVWMQDGVGPELHRVFYDTDNSAWYAGTPIDYDEPLLCGLHIQCEGVQAIHCDFIHARTGTFIEVPSNRNIEWCQFTSCYLGDSGVGGAGIHIRSNVAGRRVRGLFFSNCWSATHDRGLLIDGAHTVDGIFFDHTVFHNSARENIRIVNAAATNVVFSDCILAGPNRTATGADNIHIDTPGRIHFSDPQIGRTMAWATIPAHHFRLEAAATDVTVDGGWIDTLGVGTAAFSIATAGGLKLRGCRGVVSKNTGVASILVGASSVTVTHGLAFTPADRHIQVTPQTGWANLTQWWVDDVGPTTFRIVGNANVVGFPVGFSWSADIE